jgi:hypothetical protein
MTNEAKGATMKAHDYAHSALRELAYRASDGIEVALFWHEVTGELIVFVSETRSGVYFELAPEPDQALDVFEHPYAYVPLGETQTPVARGSQA